ncbi:uncharacterized protein [Spinacia oleracea]|uniref:Reverse transcriptase zinc-binding domain-containing protein n=1 Tax=Spinacia oleracea TaxID=3562 RepID=A0ABM3RBY5_SPIOL|nr:uncharacterized protein LOC110789426 [Spinacia oleracea]
MAVPAQASWVVRKILGAVMFLSNTTDGCSALQKNTFSISKMYYEMRGFVPSVPWRKLICNTFALPKCVFITWLTVHDRMVTCDNLQKIGVQCSMQCCLCDVGFDTVSHLFFDCPFSTNVWGVVLKWLGINRRPEKWENELQFVVMKYKAKSGFHQIYRMVVSITVYLLWRERNGRKF